MHYEYSNRVYRLIKLSTTTIHESYECIGGCTISSGPHFYLPSDEGEEENIDLERWVTIKIGNTTDFTHAHIR